MNNWRTLERTIKQDFGYSATSPFGRREAVGGFITPRTEQAFYAKVIPTLSFEDAISASGKFIVPRGAGDTRRS